MTQSICLVRLSALGDVLMFVPLVRAIQKHYPDAHLTWVISPLAYTLVEGMVGVEFIVLDKPQTLKDYWRFKKRMKCRQFDVLLAAQASLRANLLYPCIRATRKIGYDKAKSKDGHYLFVKEHVPSGRYHTLEGFLKFAQLLDVPDAPPIWDMPVEQSAYDWAKSHINTQGLPVMLVSPAASKPERSWCAVRYIEVIRNIQYQFNIQVILIGGPGAQDKAFGDTISQAVPVLNLIGQSTPKKLLALIDLATLLLCPDTGPSHMAAAMNTPVIALHAVTNVEVSGPYHCRALAINAYPKALMQYKKQTVEDAPWGTQVHIPSVMELITVDEVTAQIKTVLEQVTMARPLSLPA